MEAHGYPVHLEIDDQLGRGLAVVIGLVADDSELRLGESRRADARPVLSVKTFGVPASDEGAREVAGLLSELGAVIMAELDGLVPPQPRRRFNPTAPGPKTT